MALPSMLTTLKPTPLFHLRNPNPNPNPNFNFPHFNSIKPPIQTLTLTRKYPNFPILKSTPNFKPRHLTIPKSSLTPYFPQFSQTLNPNFPQISQTLTLIFALVKSFVARLGSVSMREMVVPLKAIALGVGKWLDIYNSVLMVRVLLSWFPNMQWELQPFSAIRDLCDPYLSFFRTILPPVNNMDLSPVLAFLVLGVVSSILNSGGSAY